MPPGNITPKKQKPGNKPESFGRATDTWSQAACGKRDLECRPHAQQRIGVVFVPGRRARKLNRPEARPTCEKLLTAKLIQNTASNVARRGNPWCKALMQSKRTRSEQLLLACSSIHRARKVLLCYLNLVPLVHLPLVCLPLLYSFGLSANNIFSSASNFPLLSGSLPLFSASPITSNCVGIGFDVGHMLIDFDMPLTWWEIHVRLTINFTEVILI
jgi:hypothetical protein